MYKPGKIFNGFVPFAFFCKMMVKFNLSLHVMAQWSRASKEIYIHCITLIFLVRYKCVGPYVHCVGLKMNEWLGRKIAFYGE